MFTITIEPTKRKYAVSEGENLLSFLQKKRIFSVEALCGGRGTCGRCKVKILEDLPFNKIEEELLTKEEGKEGIRLSCQQKVQKDLTIILPQEEKEEILTTGIKRDDGVPTMVSLPFQLDKKRAGISLQEELVEFLEKKGRGEAKIPSHISLSLSNLLEKDTSWPLLLDSDRVFYLGHIRPLGIAFDIGTTTLAGYLLDLLTGEELGVTSALNPQTIYGGDVISRITQAGKGEEESKEMAYLIRQKLTEMAQSLLEETDIPEGELLHITLVGNTCMHHLFFGLNPFSLGHAPYRPVVSRIMEGKASLFSPSLGEIPFFSFLPNIAGYVGSDTIGAILATDMMNQEQLSLLIDIGTNGEVVLGNRKRLLSCSTAAGPAFEGARISQGMMARKGAITGVTIREDLHLEVMGDVLPKGICGSGLIELIGEMLRVGLIEKGGRLLSKEELPSTTPEPIKERIKGDLFQLTGEGKVALTQGDIRQLQLAKGAIQAGVLVLMEELGVKAMDIKHIYLAGAFGNHINKGQAQRLGLLPEIPLERVVSVGNAAGEGAKLFLLNQNLRREAQKISEEVEYIELARHKKFMDYFTEAMFFPMEERG